MKNTGMPEPFEPGCYLIHFETKLKRAGHYTGSAECIFERINDHENTVCTPPQEGETKWRKSGAGAKIMGVVNYFQIEWKLARVWIDPAPRAKEQELKRHRKYADLCPYCSGDAAYGRMK